MTKKDRVKQARSESWANDELGNLKSMSVSELQDKYRELFDEDSHSRNRAYLVKRIAYRIQELAGGGLSDRARQRVDVLAQSAPMRRSPLPEPADPCHRDPRLPPAGTVIRKMYKNGVHEVTVLADGFEYCGERFNSLSAIAKKLSGMQANGFAFFGLAKAKEAA